MRMHGRSVAGAVLAGVVAVTLAGCGDVDGTSPRAVAGTGSTESSGPTAADDPTGSDRAGAASPGTSADVRLVDPDEADLVLHASNQSFADETVRLRITVDGVVVADRDFEVGSQHNWYTFPLELAPGDHEVLVLADTGVRARHTVTIPEGEVRYAVADYWDEGDGEPEITWLAQAEPLAFA